MPADMETAQKNCSRIALSGLRGVPRLQQISGRGLGKFVDRRGYPSAAPGGPRAVLEG